MSQLTLSSIPGFTDLPDSELVGDKPLTDEIMVAVNQNAKWAAIRTEHFQGYYAEGETVGLPTSLVDGYTYTRPELRYEWSYYSPLAPTGLTAGAADPPALDTESMQIGGGALDALEYTIAYVEHKAMATPGKVHVLARVNNGTSVTVINQGVVMVTTIAERLGG